MIKYENLRQMTNELQDFLDLGLAPEMCILGIMAREQSGIGVFTIQVTQLPKLGLTLPVEVKRPPDTWDRVLTVRLSPRIELLEYQCNYYQHNT